MKQTFIQKGFTLIELLIVVAVLGVLSAVVMVALNPVEQLARGRDASRINSVSQIGHALEAYATTNLNTYPPASGGAGGNWHQTLVDAGELKQVVTTTQPSSSACTTGLQSGFCYSSPAGNTSAVVWTNLESANSRTRGQCTSSQFPAAVYDSAQGKAGIACLSSATFTPVSGSITLR